MGRPFLPELEQGGGEQRQAAGLVLDVGDKRLDEVGLDLEAARWAGRSIARRSSSAAWADEDMVGAKQLGQLGVGGAATRRSPHAATSTTARWPSGAAAARRSRRRGRSLLVAQAVKSSSNWSTDQDERRRPQGGDCG